MLAIVILAVSTIIYVNNVIEVNKLLKETQILNKKFINLKNSNEILRSELNSLESPERIIVLATEKLGMIKSGSSPQIIEDKKIE